MPLRCCLATLVLGLVTACTGAGSQPVAPTATSSSPGGTPATNPCEPAVSAVTAAVAQYVAAYEATAAGADAAAAAEALNSAMATAEDALASGCAKAGLTAGLKTSLAAVPASGAVPKAVLARLRANLTGATGTAKVVEVSPGDDLAEAVATAASGASLELAAGEYRLAAPLVLLDAITLAGAGREATRLVSSAPQAAVLVLAPGLVTLSDLTLSRSKQVPGTVLVGGASTRLVAERLLVSGGRADADGQGGAGIDLSGVSDGAAATETTAELTEVEVQANSWAGLVVGTGHRVSVVAGEFVGNGECGACFLGAGGGSLERSSFSGNGVGVAAVGESTPVLAGNRISGGKVGIQVGDTATPSITGTRISKAKRAGVIYTDTAAGVLRKTRCIDLPAGIVLAPKTLPSLSANSGCSVLRSKK